MDRIDEIINEQSKSINKLAKANNAMSNEVLRLSDEITRLTAENEALQKYKAHSEAISRLNSCNDCGEAKHCLHRPKLGTWVRINCHFWRGEEQCLT